MKLSLLFFSFSKSLKFYSVRHFKSEMKQRFKAFSKSDLALIVFEIVFSYYLLVIK